MNNSFGLRIHDIKDLLQSRSVAKVVRYMLLSVLDHLGIPSERADEIVGECLTLARDYSSLSDYEKAAHGILERNGVTTEVPDKMTGRARMLSLQVRPYLLPGPVLDFGCGDGKVGQLLAREGFNVVLADVSRHQNIERVNLEFRLIGEEKGFHRSENEFDTTLVLTVLHHSDAPAEALQKAHGVTRAGGRVIVIESVYGVKGQGLPEAERRRARRHLSLTREEQRMVNIFFDHFYNRVIHFSSDPKTKARIPYNFNTPEGWKKIFEDNGFKQEKVVHLGIDQPSVPEYHTLHVLRVIKQQGRVPAR